MKRILAVLVTTALMVALTAMPALAAKQNQNGLVNVAVGDVVVQVPIGIAANVCPNLNANVLAQQFAGTDQVANCNADAQGLATLQRHAR